MGTLGLVAALWLAGTLGGTGGLGLSGSLWLAEGLGPKEIVLDSLHAQRCTDA